MSELQIALDLQTKIKAGLSDTYGTRVDIVASRIAHLYANPSADPSIAIVYMGSDGTDEKGRVRSTETHRFELTIFQTIWEEETVITDATSGLLALRDGLISLVEGVVTGYSSSVLDVAVTDKTGTQDYDTGDNKYKASISITLSILEEK